MQSLIDALAYPPTHTYQLDGLVPTGVLAERWGYLYSMTEFWSQGESFLDVGSNKGFFSLTAAQLMKVHALEPGLQEYELCKKLGIDVVHQTFRDYPIHQQYDRIFLGNVHHYLYRECDGWAWVDKLAVMSNGLVLIEGPSDKCVDLERCLSPELYQAYNRTAFLSTMARDFELISERGTVSYTPGREIFLFRRRPVQQLPEPAIHSIMRHRRYDGGGYEKCLVLRDGEKVYKLYKDPDEYMRHRIAIAARSPRSNGVIGFTESGWAEPWIDTNQYVGDAEVWENYRAHQVYLAKMGYTDLDPGPTNWTKLSYGPTTFDKNAVWPIAELTDKQIRDGILTYQGWGPCDLTQLEQVLRTRSSVEVEKFFALS